MSQVRAARRLGSTFVGVSLRLALLASVAGCAAEKSEPIWSLSGATMGTRYNVSVVGGDEADAKALQQRLDERLAEVNRRMSTYDPQSELSRFNAGDSTDWFDVSAETASVVQSALELASASEGAFDPTVGPLVNLWGFGPDKRRDEAPSDGDIAAAKARVGFAAVEARLDPPALRKATPGVYLDLSAIAKGHGVDAVAELIAEAGYAAAMVEIGGEVRAFGAKPGGKPWRIGLEKPESGLTHSLQEVIELSDRSLATSGDYRNFFEVDGRRYSHTIDAATGRPVTHNLATVTVQATTCRDADGLATTLLVLGPTAGYDWAVGRGVAALFVSRTDDELIERTTPAWERPADHPGTKP
ncbi:Thiamine biosynthesis lipoprotein ApbE precursor [Botrimarina colliarenosi]|uniref:FAD:protein FMN transferase n=2 Tax=Botrimarina colliarenosi TaxID=2528001 RepID=A0A5C6AF89_9BACT|nr:Thiamine biosynthesis lipoprotein ApbE precursor [Botrimarina colliarenosi]